MATGPKQSRFRSIRQLLRRKDDESPASSKTGITTSANARLLSPTPEEVSSATKPSSVPAQDAQLTPPAYVVSIRQAPGLPKSLWDQAVEAVKARDKTLLEHVNIGPEDQTSTNQKIDSNNRNGKIESGGLGICRDVLQLAQKKGEECEGEAWAKVRGIYESIVKWVQKFVQVGDIVAQVDPVHIGLPWAALRFILQMSVNDMNENLAVLQGINTITSLLYRYRIFENVYLYGEHPLPAETRAQVDRVVKDLYTAVLIYLLKARKYKKQSAWTRLPKAIFPTGEFEELLKDVGDKDAEVQKYECLALAEKEYSRFLELRKLLGAHDDHLEGQKREEILRWLSSIKYNAHHRDIIENVLDGSGKWLFEKTEFQQWSSMTVSSLLWIRGDPGSGKTNLISVVVEDMLKQHPLQKHQLNGQKALAFFYCSRTTGESERQEPKDILRCIVKQLSSPLYGLPLKEPVVTKYEREKQANALDAPLTIKDSKDMILRLIREQYTHVTIVIDALDECNRNTRIALFNFLEEVLLQEQGAVVKILISSRTEPDIYDAFGKSSNLYINAEDNAEDIKRFVEEQIDKRLLRGKAEEELKGRVKKELCTKSQGIFRWVALQIDAICDANLVYSASSVEWRLKRLPKTLEDTYTEILENISLYDPDQKHVATNALKWLMCAQRQLTVQELLVALSTTPNGPTHAYAKDDILQMCRSLVVVDEKRDTFRLSHLSVKEYLEALGTGSRNAVEGFNFEVIEMNATAALTCLFSLSRKRTSGKLQEPGVNGFHSYSLYNWAIHCRMAAEHRTTGDLGKAFKSFLLTAEESPSFDKWHRDVREEWRKLGFDDYKPIERLRDCLSFTSARFFTACAFDLPEVINMVFDGQEIAEIRNNVGRSGLTVACRNDSFEVFQLLSSLGCPMGEQDTETKDPLEVAVKFTSLRIMEHLLAQENASITEKVVEAAVGNEDGGPVVVELMLKLGKEIPITEKIVKAAAGNSSSGVEVLGLLLKQDREIPITQEIIETAALRGSKSSEVLELLLKQGGEFPITEEIMLAAVQNFRGCVAAMEFLLKQGSEVPITERVVKSAARSVFSGIELLELLFRQDREIPITEDVLVAAGENWDTGLKVMELLLRRDRGIPITEKVVTAVAGSQYDSGLLRLLLSHDREIPITEGVILATALNWRGDTKSMELLLERNPEVPITEPIVLAAAKNRNNGPGLMSLLLKKDREIPITESVLEAAAHNRSRGVLVIEELQKYGREITFTEKVVEAALYEDGNPLMLQLMRKQDVEIPITEQTIMGMAEYERLGVLETMEVLQDMDIPVTEEVVKAVVARMVEGEEIGMMDILIKQDKEIVISTEIVLEVARNKESGFELMEMLLEGRKTTVADEAVPVIASLFGKQITKLLGVKRAG